MVKRAITFTILLAMLALLVFSAGCGSSDNGGADNGENGGITQTDYDLGLVEGYAEGYDQGYSDGGDESYDPEPGLDESWNEDYAAGYEEGYLEGYEDGYDDAVEDTDGGADETAEVEAAMIAFVEENSAPGMEFVIENIVISGDEAAGRAVCTSETLESPYIIVKKGPSGWYGVDFGTGIEPPDWYPY
ncbi:MAG: hypothetical protein JW854_02720 [Actinobacteria bacterium]|nr:hypothetical protein [Actinomycetota bacterium]